MLEWRNGHKSWAHLALHGHGLFRDFSCRQRLLLEEAEAYRAVKASTCLPIHLALIDIRDCFAGGGDGDDDAVVAHDHTEQPGWLRSPKT